MVRRQIELDEETDQIFGELARNYEGDLSRTVAELVRAHQGIENLVEGCEQANSASLQAQLERSKRDFEDGNITPWDEVKRRSNL